MKLILAEKPSQARDIARAFESKTKCNNREGYIECGEWVITWAFGHLFEIDTEKIFPYGKILEFPEKFEYRLKDRTSKKQFQVIKELLKRADEVYVFTDPEREGELIARIILYQAGWKKWESTYRFWSSKALTFDVIWEEIKAKRPIKKFDSLFYEALARQHADWLVGIPLSRVIMSKFKDRGGWSVGRVQTPTLKLIVDRELERETFVEREYFVIKAKFEKEGGEGYEGILFFKEDKKDENRNEENEKREEEGEEEEIREEEGSSFFDKEKVKEIFERLKKEKVGVVIDIRKILKKEAPPLLFSLTVLQKEAGRFFGFSASKTLDIAQSLYEKKLISYPRTESQYLSEKDKDFVISVLKKLGREDLCSVVLKVGKRVFDDSKLTDHFALIPLNKPEVKLSDDERKVYDLVVRRFLAVFYSDFVWEEVKVETRVGEFSFISKGIVIKEKGWTEIYSYGGRKERFLPLFLRGEKVEVKTVDIEKKKTKPRGRYSDGVLVSKMKKLGIGTPATRASIIEGLNKRGYLKRKGKELIPDLKGRYLVFELQKLGSSLLSVELTKEWEDKLRKIRDKDLGFRGYKEFLDGIKKFVIENAKILERIEDMREMREMKESNRKEGNRRKVKRRGFKGIKR